MDNLVIRDGLYFKKFTNVPFTGEVTGRQQELFKQGFNPAVFHRIAIAVEGIAGQAHDLAGLGDIAEFLRQIEQADFMLDDFVIIVKYEGYLFFVFR